jgi:hypothetical protein
MAGDMVKEIKTIHIPHNEFFKIFSLNYFFIYKIGIVLFFLLENDFFFFLFFLYFGKRVTKNGKLWREREINKINIKDKYIVKDQRSML